MASVNEKTAQGDVSTDTASPGLEKVSTDEYLLQDLDGQRVWRCRWCGRKVHGVRRLFHNPAKCKALMAAPRVGIGLNAKDESARAWDEEHQVWP